MSKDDIARAAVGAVATMLVLAMGILIHLQTSLSQAVNDLTVCQADGRAGCHIERDGLDYAVHGK